MVELLAPAGDPACFKAALIAGADAIYVGGKKYGARAYAGNFEQEDLIECLHLAHLFGKKVYLTINTLMKQNEIDGLVSFLQPYYEEGLDGVIVQDLGVLMQIRKVFPQLELHASTQMTVTGAYGAGLLKQYGVSRVVPARELSLEEIYDIKEKTGLEIETFVHGAMCYGYSGQCLFSSMLGERSGNRGRCAGPCRLPYTVKYDEKLLNRDDEMYQLSLKDLCTLEVLPKLIDAGIDSFKIEGRMKTPEYVTFVTGMYRKYIDLYEKDPKNYYVSKEDMNMLKNRFSRGSIQPGYYFIHNGRELLTLDKPGYQSFTTEEKGMECTETFDDLKIDLIGHFCAHEKSQICFSVCCKESPETTVVALGPIPSLAQKCAAAPDDVKKQLCKTGNTSFTFDEITFDMGDNLFLPNKILNDLRRDAVSQLEELLLQKYRRIMPVFENQKSQAQIVEDKNIKKLLWVEVHMMEQLSAIADTDDIHRICLDSDIFMREDNINIVVETLQRIRKSGTEIFIKLPHVCRQKTIKIIEKYRTLLKEISPDGFCVGNLESLAYICENYPDTKIISDSGFYVFNAETTEFFTENNISEHILPYELHRKEISELIKIKRHQFFLPVYGYIPVMETAGCLLKTNGVCRNGKGAEQVVLTDRYKKDRIVVTHCDRCENTIYNSVPLSLHKEKETISEMPLDGIVLKFTIENAEQTKRVLDFWQDRLSSEMFVMHDFTKGHFTKGVE